MTDGARTRRPPRTEAQLVEIVRRYLVGEGYRVYVDPDGTDYFDVVARRDGEVGLVEVKVAGPHAVLAQALRRRAWGDWCAVALGSARSAERLAAYTLGRRAAPIGIWSVGPDSVRVHRAALPWSSVGSDTPFVETRARFRRWLEEVDALAPDASVHFSGVVGEVRRASGGRTFGEWRLDEGIDPPT